MIQLPFNTTSLIKKTLVMFIALNLLGCESIPGMSPGSNSGTASTGAAAGGTSVGGNSNMPRCDQPLGTLAVDDGRGKDWYAQFGRATNITTIEPLIRLAVAQSNCFIITSIGNSATDSKLSGITAKQRGSGEYRAGSNQQKGQRVAADYFLEPAIIIDDSPSSSLSGAAGKFLNGALATVAGGFKSKDSTVTLSLFDIRSSVQISISDGNSNASNYGTAVGGLGGGAGGGLSSFKKSPEGKATVAAFVDAYGKMVTALKNYKAQSVEGGSGTGGALKVN